MTTRINPYTSHFKLVQPLIDYGTKVQAMGLEKSLLLLIEVRASQINGCGVCLDMHSRDAVKHGETWERIVMLDAWRETSAFTSREKAAMAWTETLTRLAEKGAPDHVYEQVKAEFSDEEIVALTLMINVINSFNRIGAGFHVPPLSEQRKAA
jgi:AhpD family alkylhydroperoxidase